jgi:capsular exopolysaccharide synthesis family protein
MMGLLLFGFAFTEFRSRKVNSSDEITLGLGISTVGTLPLLPAQVRQAALSATTSRDLQWEGRLTEAVDAVRTFLLRSLGEGPHVVLVTSAVQGEGKTSLASQLAASLARAWRKTLLIDGDLRKPAAHQLFDLPGEPGFSDVLRGETDPADVIKQTGVSRLWLMPAGQWDPHAQQALAQEGVATLFEHLKEEFDLIIVDSCPVLPVTDTLLLGQHVDTVLLSVLKGTSRLPMVYAARQRLGALDIPVLGTVFVGGSSALGGLDIQYPHPSR